MWRLEYGGTVTMRLEQIQLTDWKEALQNQKCSPFHTAEALEAIDKHTDAEMRLFAGFNGQRPVALLPIFIKDVPIGKIVLSPPLGLGIRRLGPILMPASPKRSKREKINSKFAEQVIETVDADTMSTLFWVSCETEFRDPRPYKWAGFNVESLYTYQLDLGSSTKEEVLNSFSRSLRREIKDGESGDIRIQRRGQAGAHDVYEATKDRYEEQDKTFDLSQEFMFDLIEALGDHAAVYVAESADGEFLSGIIVLYSNDTAYFWKGGTRQEQLDHNVNSLLHWNVITDIFEDPSKESINKYDFSTANNRNIVQYKRKFGGKLETYYRIESNSLPMTIAKRAYRLR